MPIPIVRMIFCGGILAAALLWPYQEFSLQPAQLWAGQVSAATSMAVKQSQFCSAYMPNDWSFSNNQQASTAEALSSDRSMYAGWGILSVNKAMEPYYGPLYGDPEKSIMYLTSQIFQQHLGDSSPVSYTSGPEDFLGYFSLRAISSQRFEGWVFYKIYPMGPMEYIESVYWAVGARSPGQQKARIAAGVTVSLRCQTQFRPPDYSSGGGGEKAGRNGCGTGGALTGYQKELGTQYAHSRETGENYLFDVSQWQENGTQGPGYYREKGGGDYEKLELGRSDDC